MGRLSSLVVMAFIFFCVFLHPIIKRLADEVPDLLLNVCYLDGGTLVGKLDALRKAVIDLLNLRDP